MSDYRRVTLIMGHTVQDNFDTSWNGCLSNVILVVQWKLRFWTQKPPNGNPDNHLNQTSMFGFKLLIFLDFLSSLLPIFWKAEVEVNPMSLKAKNKVHRKKSKGDFQAFPIHKALGSIIQFDITNHYLPEVSQETPLKSYHPTQQERIVLLYHHFSGPSWLNFGGIKNWVVFT